MSEKSTENKQNSLSERTGKFVGGVAKGISWGFKELGVKRGIINAKKGICKVTGTDHKKVDQAMYGTSAVVGTLYGVTSAAAAATTGLAVAGVGGVSYVVGKQIAPKATDATANAIGSAAIGSMGAIQGFSKGFSAVIYDENGNEVNSDPKPEKRQDEDFDPFEKSSNTSSYAPPKFNLNTGIQREKFTPDADAEFDDPFEFDSRFEDNSTKPKIEKAKEPFDDPFAEDSRFNDDFEETKKNKNSKTLEGYEIYDFDSEAEKSEDFGVRLPDFNPNKRETSLLPKAKKQVLSSFPSRPPFKMEPFPEMETFPEMRPYQPPEEFAAKPSFDGLFDSLTMSSSTNSNPMESDRTFHFESKPKENAQKPFSPPPLPKKDDIWDLFS